MKISSVSKKVLASALSAAMVVAFAPTVAFGADVEAAQVSYTNADTGAHTAVAYYNADKAFAAAVTPNKLDVNAPNPNPVDYDESESTVVLSADAELTKAIVDDANTLNNNYVLVSGKFVAATGMAKAGVVYYDMTANPVSGSHTIVAGDYVAGTGADTGKYVPATVGSVLTSGNYYTFAVDAAAAGDATAVTVDLNGHKLSTKAGTAGTHMDLTVAGTGEIASGAFDTITVAKDASVTISGGTFNKLVIAKGATVAVSGGTVAAMDVDASASLVITGGTFTKATANPAGYYNASAYKEVGTSTVSIQATDVAGGTTANGTLSDKLAETNALTTDNYTVTLGSDAYLAAADTIGTSSVAATATLNGNGKAITGSKLTAQGKVVIKNVVLKNDLEIANSADVTLEDVTLDKDSKITIATGGTAGKLVIKSGTYAGAVEATEIKGGSFSGTVNCASGITAGTFTGTVTGNVKGGTFKTSPTVANNYAAFQNEDKTYTVKAGIDAAHVSITGTTAADMGKSVVVNAKILNDTTTVAEGALTKAIREQVSTLFASVNDETGATPTTVVIDGKNALIAGMGTAAQYANLAMSKVTVPASESTSATAVANALAKAKADAAFSLAASIDSASGNVTTAATTVSSFGTPVTVKIDVTNVIGTGATARENLKIVSVAKDGTLTQVASEEVKGSAATGDADKTYLVMSVTALGQTYAVVSESVFDNVVNKVEEEQPAVEKATQGIDVAQKSKTVKLAKGKTKTQKAITFKLGASAETGLTIAKKSGSSRISVSGQKVTLKKGTKAGAYTAKVSIKAAASDEYLAAAKTITVKFVVKK